MNHTKIEWVKNPDGTQGYTWNPITGCLKGCEYCYARKLANGRLKSRYLANRNTIPSHPLKNYSSKEFDPKYIDPFYPRFWPERLNDVKRGYHYRDWSGVSAFAAAPRGIFVCDMSDLFGIGIPEEWTRRVLSTIGGDVENYKDRFYLLTKQPQNLQKWSPFPENCWVGVTATDFVQYGVAGIYLPDIKAGVKFLSFEPLLERITDKTGQYNALMMAEDLKFAGINWTIIGAQTNPYKPPKIEWVQEIVEAADKAGAAVFLKDNLQSLWKDDLFYPEWAMAKGDFCLRQETPVNRK